jgi:hypothetical protein
VYSQGCGTHPSRRTAVRRRLTRGSLPCPVARLEHREQLRLEGAG